MEPPHCNGVLKAATAIALARRLESEHEVRCVPIFWVQEEDHDRDEVAWHAWLGRDGQLRRARLPGDARDRVSLAHLGLAGVDGLLAQLAGDLERAPHGAAVTALLRRHYASDRGIAEAFAGALAEIFSHEGLLVLRPRTPEIAGALASLHLRCIDEAAAIEAALRERAGALEAAGYHPQIELRASAALSFYHPDGATGARYRVLCRGRNFVLAGSGRRIARADLEAAADDEPLRFSTSALLRPIAQDLLLPTAAYVAGPSELAYLGQLSPLYDHVGRPMPLIAPRLRLRWLDPQRAELLGDAPREAETLADDGALARALARADGAPDDSIDLEALASGLYAALDRELGPARAALAELDPGLGKACDRTRESAAKSFDKLLRKATRAALGRAPDARAALESMRALVCPGGQPQERVLGWTTLAAHLGAERLRRECLSTDPLALDLFVRELVA